MDTSKNIGKIKEQIEREHIARRKYAKKWGKLIAPEVTQFYNPNEVSCQLKQQLQYQNLCPFRYTGEGESYFVSRDMYESLCSKCRCGRPRTDMHMLRCLQKEIDKFDQCNDDRNEISDDVQTAGNKHQLPKTSNAVIGFTHKKPIYQQWEQSMKYISPVYTMPGFRITATPYNAIIIG